MEIDRRAFIASLGGTAAVALMSSEEKADALEHYMEERLDELALLQQQGGGTPPTYPTMAEIEAANAKRTGVRRGAGNVFNASGRDGQPRGPLPALSDRPTLLEFFEKRFAPANHVLQSATRALKTGMPEEIILACLLHDTVLTMMKVDHGWWGAQMSSRTSPSERRLPFATIRRCASTPTRNSATSTRKAICGLLARTTSPSRTRADLSDGPQAQVVRRASSRHRQRSVLVRSQRQGVDRTVHRHHRPPLQAAERRARLQSQPDGAYVANDDVPGSTALSQSDANALPRERGRGATAAARMPTVIRSSAHAPVMRCNSVHFSGCFHSARARDAAGADPRTGSPLLRRWPYRRKPSRAVLQGAFGVRAAR